MKPYFRIGELSALYHIGVDSLRYYEEIGLISPKRSESGYRLYSQNDIWRLNVIRDLRSLGFPTEVIKQYLDFQNVDTALTLLQEEQKALEEKQKTLQKLQQNVEQRIRSIRIARELPLNEITCKTFPDRPCFRLDRGYSADSEMDVLLKQLLNQTEGSSGIIGNHQIGSLLAPAADGSVTYRSVFAIDPRGDQILPGGMFLCVTYPGDYARSGDWVRRLLDRAKDGNLTVRGDILELLWIDVHTSSDVREYITELQMPVEPQNRQESDRPDTAET